MFIRVKVIKHKPYAYLVQNTWRKKRTKQKVKKYLGAVIDVPETTPPTIAETTIAEEILQEAISQELENLEEPVKITALTVKRDKRPVVLRLNGGFLCNYTLRQIKEELQPQEEDRPGTALAQAITNAGIRIDQQAFIKLYMEYCT